MHNQQILNKDGLFRIIAICFGMSLLFSGSCKNYLCESHQILSAFKYYDPAMYDSFILKKYKQADSFQTLIDTMLIINLEVNSTAGNAVFTRSGDSMTIVAVDNKNPNAGIVPGYDWQIILPLLHDTFKIYNLSYPQLDGVEPCDNALLSYYEKIPDTTFFVSSPYYSATENPNTTGYLVFINRMKN